MSWFRRKIRDSIRGAMFVSYAELQRVLDARTGDSVPGLNPNARLEGSEPAPGDQIISDLERLERLHQSGALTNDEFEAQKARILRGA